MKEHHRINYIEFPAKRLPLLKQFYSTVFGWRFTDYGPGYAAFEDGTLEGGFDVDSTRGQSGPLVILYSTDLEASLAAVEHNGGTVTEPIFAFPGGRRFHFADPDGNELAVWSE